MKVIRICFYVASVIVVLLMFVYAFINNYSYMELYNNIKTRIENRFSALPNDEFFDRLYFDYLRATGRRHFNGVTFLNDGRLMFDTLHNNAFLEERAGAFIGLNNYVTKDGTPFLFVSTPSKLKDNSYLPLAFSNNPIIENANTLMNILYENNVDVLDLRTEMNNDGIDYYSAFFHGDHHWKAETALWAFGRILETVNERYDFNINSNAWNPQQYEHITHKLAFLGEESIAANALHNFEDITFLVPNASGEYTVTDLWSERYGVVGSGSFAEVFIPRLNNEYDETLNFSDFNAFMRYFFRYENPAAPERQKVLLITDSMGIPIATYFAATFETVDFMYLMYNQNDRIWPVINATDHDFVVFILSDMSISFEDEDIFENDRFFFSRPPG